MIQTLFQKKLNYLFEELNMKGKEKDYNHTINLLRLINRVIKYETTSKLY